MSVLGGADSYGPGAAMVWSDEDLGSFGGRPFAVDRAILQDNPDCYILPEHGRIRPYVIVCFGLESGMGSSGRTVRDPRSRLYVVEM
ncbi:MAG: hypothetical protein HKL95_02260 [Phycisphaerae bacterium]|nr:hypothetical protein [Phycisphaerae bacterium]